MGQMIKILLGVCGFKKDAKLGLIKGLASKIYFFSGPKELEGLNPSNPRQWRGLSGGSHVVNLEIFFLFAYTSF